jgi:hypothetical protein
MAWRPEGSNRKTGRNFRECRQHCSSRRAARSSMLLGPACSQEGCEAAGTFERDYLCAAAAAAAAGMCACDGTCDSLAPVRSAPDEPWLQALRFGTLGLESAMVATVSALVMLFAVARCAWQRAAAGSSAGTSNATRRSSFPGAMLLIAVLWAGVLLRSAKCLFFKTAGALPEAKRLGAVSLAQLPDETLEILCGVPRHAAARPTDADARHAQASVTPATSHACSVCLAAATWPRRTSPCGTGH